jgi:mannuronan 5-epimerase
MLSNNKYPNFISILGSANIDGVKITSWDPVIKAPIQQNVNGSNVRPFIIIDKSHGTLNISNSEIGYLGFNDYPSNGIVFARGGDGSNLINNSIHDMWDGFYSDSAGHLTIKNNTYFNNLRYGIDPHSGSHDLDIINNTVFNSTKIGIICSENCFNILFLNNTVHDNGIAGLMFSLNTKNSTASGNFAFNEDVGMSVFSSSNNTLYDNIFSSNNIGIFLAGNSSDNHVYKNKLKDQNYGIYLTDSPVDNLLIKNDMTNISTPIRVPNDKSSRN